MSLPGETLLKNIKPAPFLNGDDAPPLGRISREMGPRAINAGTIVPIDVRMWFAESAGGKIFIYPEDTPSATTTLVEEDANSVSLAFDQSGRPHIAYMAVGVAKLYWYDAVTNQFSTFVIPGASTPILTMDDKRFFSSLANRNDILCFYIGPRGLSYRQQRDRFGVERVLDPSENGSIRRAGLCTDWRLRVETA